MKDDVWMQLALEQASCAYRANEVPVGALIVHDNAVLSADHNRMREHHDPTAHAEMLVMKEAYARIGTLKGCTMYVTLEHAQCAPAQYCRCVWARLSSEHMTNEQDAAVLS